VRLILASASPRRSELLRQMGLRFEVMSANVDETRFAGESPRAYVSRLAEAKARASSVPGALVIGADTAVVCDDEILGKPCCQKEAVDALLLLSGRTHEVITGVCVTDGQTLRRRVVTTEVRFREVDRQTLVRYWNTGEGSDKAGSYGIQGIGGIFADRIAGSYSAVVGLPLSETEELLRAFQFDTWRDR